jgi:hypothetical protein
MADTKYVIDIAAQIDGTESSKQLDALADALSGSGRQAAAFEDALTQLRAQMKAASAASADANAALAAGKAEYSQLERAALNAARTAERAELQRVQAIEKAQARLVAAQRALDSAGPSASTAQMQRYRAAVEKAGAALRRAGDSSGLDAARAAAAQAKASLDKYDSTLRKLEADAKQAAAAQAKLGKTMSNAERITKRSVDRLGDAATKLSTFRGALGDVGGPLGNLAERALYPVQAFVDLSEWFGIAAAASTVAVVGMAALAAALAVVAAAAAAATLAFTAMAVKIADVARGARLTAEAFNAAYPEIASVSSGFGRLTQQTGLAADQLRDLTMQLKSAKVSATDMPQALRAVAFAESALGRGKGLAYFNEQLKKAHGNVAALAIETERKFGGIVSRKMLGLEAQGARLQANIGGLFAGLDIEPALLGFRTLVALFDKNTTAGRFLRAVLEGVLQPIIDQAQNAAWAIEAFFLGLAIGAVKTYIALKPVISAATELLGIDVESWDLETVLKAITQAGELAAPILLGLGVAAGLLGVALVATTAIALAPLAVLISTIVGVGYVLYQLASIAAEAGAAFGLALNSAVTGVIEWLQGLVGVVTQVGADIIQGLANGITGAAGAVMSAMTGAVGGAIAAAKRQLGIASPSKVFAEIGGYTTEGFARGVDAGTGDAQAAMSDLVTPNVAPASNTTTSSSTSVRTTNASQNVFNIMLGPGSGAQQAQDFYEWLTRALEGDAAALAGAAS